MLDSSILDAAKFQFSPLGGKNFSPGGKFLRLCVNIKKIKANTIFSFFRFIRFVMIIILVQRSIYDSERVLPIVFYCSTQ